jgi:hypothetical protein
MTMQFLLNQQTTGTSTANIMNYLFRWKEWMVSTVGWRIPQSSNGTTGGSTGGTGTGGVGDHIATESDLSQYSADTSESWFILQSPTGTQEILFYRYSSSDDEWAVNYSATGFPETYGGFLAYENRPDNPADSVAVIGGGRDLFVAGNARFHLAADDAAPYGFWCWVHTIGNFAGGQHFFTMVPITDAVQPGDTDPVIFCVTADGSQVLDSEFDYPLATGAQSRVVGYLGNQGDALVLAVWKLQEQVQQPVPSDLPPDNNGDDLTFPIMVGRSGTSGSGGFKGLSTFMQMNGTTRAAGETFALATRISVGDFNVEWDPTVTPASS